MIAGSPRVLIVDDDAVSLCFLRTALEGFGATVHAAADAAAALAAAARAAPDLLLIDRRLGDADGTDLLRELRAAGIAARAIATSAALDRHIIGALLAAGFADTLHKPASVADVHTAVSRCLAGAAGAAGPVGTPPPDGAALLDDAAALGAIGGDPAALAALRRLFLAELQAVENDLEAGAANEAALRQRLHRLRASCGFCGAAALGAATLLLEQACDAAAPVRQSALSHFRQACRSTIAALAAARA